MVTGNGVSENDMIAFTAGLCSEATPIPITRIHNEYGIQMMVFPETGMGIHVCYKYGGLEWMMLTTTVNIREVYSLDVDKLPLDLVAKLTLSGVCLTTEDKLCLMNSESVCSYCEQEIFAGRVFSVQGETTLFSMVHMTSQVTVRMCYKYASYQNFVAIGDVVMTVVPPALNSILPTRIVGNVANTISFTGDFMGGEILSGNVEAVLTTSDVNCYIDRVTLANGDVAVALHNHGEEVVDIPLDFKIIGNKMKYSLRDLYEHEELGEFEGRYVAKSVPVHGVQMLRLTPIA